MWVQKKEMQMSIPHLFRCPISLDLFTDPVTLRTGQTYDRTSIEKWFADGHTTCPITMQRLDDMSLVPNLALRRLINQWILNDCNLQPDSAELSLATLRHRLQCKNTADPAKLEILKKVRILVLESDIAKNCFARLGFVPLLLHLVFSSTASDRAELVEVGLDCVLGLMTSREFDSCNNLLQEGNHLASLVQLLEHGNARIKTSLCHFLEAIPASFATIGQSQRILQALVSILHANSDGNTLSEAAVRAVASICSVETNRANAIAQDSIGGLVTFLESSSAHSSSTTISCALATLEALLGSEAGKMAFAKNRNAVRVLVKHVFAMLPDEGASEHAVGALQVVCGAAGSRRTRADALDAGAWTQLLLLLQSQCSSRAKAKARALLKLLRAMWHEDPGECDL